MSYVATLTTDAGSAENPTWPDAELKILALDSRTFTIVILAPLTKALPDNNSSHMAIGGGANDSVIVYITDDNLRFWNPIDPSRSDFDSKISVLIGGQIGEYRASQFVSRKLALLAARQYFDDGTRAPNLVWSE